MTDIQPLIVSYQEESRAKFETSLVQLSRSNALRSIPLIVVWTLFVIILPLVIVAIEHETVTSALAIYLLIMLVPPAAGTLSVVWQLRHPPTVAAHVMTVTSTHVIFERRESLLFPLRAKARQEWDRSATRFVIHPATKLPPTTQSVVWFRFATSTKDNGQNALRMMLASRKIAFHLEGGGREHRWAFPIDMLDTSVETIIAAIEQPGTTPPCG